MPVQLKIVNKVRHPHERELHQYLTSEKLLSDLRNNCVPLLEVVADVDGDKDKEMLVMPLYRKCGSPTFDTVGEVLELLRQLIEVRNSLVIRY
jgi:hypothetical protein